MAAAAQIQVTGLKELRKSLRGFESDTDWRPALREAYTTTAKQVEQSALGRAGSSRMGSAARATIKGKGTTTGATLRGGSASVPWFVGFNFGSIRYRQFPPKGNPDYVLYATMTAERDSIEAEFLGQIDRALSGAQL